MDEDTIPDHVNPQHTDVPLPVLQMCQELSEISMFDAFLWNVVIFDLSTSLERNRIPAASSDGPRRKRLCVPQHACCRQDKSKEVERTTHF